MFQTNAVQTTKTPAKLRHAGFRCFRAALASLFCLAVLAAVQPSPAEARQVCGDRTELMKKLETEHEEAQESMGIAADGSLLEVFVSDNGGWTMLVTYPGRPSCVVATGKDWHRLTVQASTGEIS